MTKKFENDLMEQRYQTGEEIRESGDNPYANDFKVGAKQTAAKVHAECGELDGETLAELNKRYTVAGRVIAVRSFGKAAFVQLRDRTGDIQIYIQRDKVGKPVFEEFKKTDIGDFIGIRGTAFRTKVNELSVKATKFRLLTKSLRPLPEKFHGLTDKETRYRQRYVDLIVNREVRTAFETRSKVIRYIRDYFNKRDFLEVETPMMHPILGGATAKPFVTHHNALDMKLYLRVAPELYLKRLVVGGIERVFELNKNFRNEGLSAQHNPEFTMLEFYQAYATFEDLMDLTEKLFSSLVEKLFDSSVLTYQGQEIDFAPGWQRLTMVEALVKYGALTLEEVQDTDKLADYAKRLGFETKGVPHGKLLADCFEEVAEPHFIQPTFVTQYPAEVSPLSRRNEEDPRFTDRFELYIAGREIANGFSELNDPVDQMERFQDQGAQREAGDEEAQMVDEDYVRALEYGMPPTAGEGIGIDRLVMLLTDSASIRDVIPFPHMRPEAG
jgi:lysyl-tRNA synthetase class 2